MDRNKKRLLSYDKEKEFESFFKKYYEKMIATAYRILGNYSLAEDAVSDSFIRMSKNWGTITGLSSEQIDYYVFITTKNSALNILKKEQMYIDIIEFDDNMLSDDNLHNISDEFIIEQMKLLSSKNREILYLKYSVGLDYKSIAGVIGISVAAARKRVQYAKKNLAKLLKDGGVSLE